MLRFSAFGRTRPEEMVHASAAVCHTTQSATETEGLCPLNRFAALRPLPIQPVKLHTLCRCRGTFDSVGATWDRSCGVRTDRTLVCRGGYQGGLGTPSAGIRGRASRAGWTWCGVRARCVRGPGADPDRPVGRVAVWARRPGCRPDEVVKAIGSRLHGNRRRWRLVADPTVGTIVVEHRERLTRFGFEHLEAAWVGRGARMPVMAETFQVPADLIVAIPQIRQHMVGTGEVAMAGQQRRGGPADQHRTRHFSLQARRRCEQGVPVGAFSRIGAQSPATSRRGPDCRGCRSGRNTGE